jgi:hypothetical protein
LKTKTTDAYLLMMEFKMKVEDVVKEYDSECCRMAFLRGIELARQYTQDLIDVLTCRENQTLEAINKKIEEELNEQRRG